MPSAQWQWAGIIIGSIAFILSLLGLSIMSIIQAIYQKPKLKIHHKEYMNYGIGYELQNSPIDNTIISRIASRQPIQELGARLYIERINPNKDSITNMIYGDKFDRLIMFNDSRSRHITLPPSKWADSWGKIVINKRINGKIFINGHNNDTQNELADGEYKASLVISADGLQIEDETVFTVYTKKNNESFIKWETKGELQVL